MQGGLVGAHEDRLPNAYDGVTPVEDQSEECETRMIPWVVRSSSRSRTSRCGGDAVEVLGGLVEDQDGAALW